MSDLIEELRYGPTHKSLLFAVWIAAGGPAEAFHFAIKYLIDAGIINDNNDILELA